MQKNQAAVELGRLGGQSTSKRKAAAARENAKLGGWPKGKKRGSRRKLDANQIAHGVVAKAEKITQRLPHVLPSPKDR